VVTVDEDGGVTVDAAVPVEMPARADGVVRQVELVDRHSARVRVHVPGASTVIDDLVAGPGERWLGFGERSHLVSLAAGAIENYVGEGTFQPHEYPFLREIIPNWAMRERRDATYFPIPWALSTRGYGLLVENDGLSVFRFRTARDDRWHVQIDSDSLVYRIFVGRDPSEALCWFTEATGRQPEPERWFFGPWFQTGHENHVPLDVERRQLERQLAAGAQVVAAETHCRYLPVGEDRGYEEDERARTSFFHGRGLKVLSYLNPFVSQDYPEAFEEASRAGALQKNSDGEDYVYSAYAGGRNPPLTMETQYDFTNPNASECWQRVAERLVAAGYDGWMEDFGEYTPLDVVQSDGTTGTEAHNRYPTTYHAAAALVARRLEDSSGRRLARFVRSGWTGTAAHAPVVWGGDPTTGWGFNGLASALIEALSAGASGIAMWGSDCGGFASTTEQLTPELLRRWIQFAAFSPVMRTKAGGIAIPDYERPQVWDGEVLATWVRYTRIHRSLLDYFAEAHASYRRSGRPIMAALELVFPNEPLLLGVVDEYLLGEQILVCPVLLPGVTTRTVVLPPGQWRDAFDPTGPTFAGPLCLEVAVTPEDLPVFCRSDSEIVIGETATAIGTSDLWSDLG